jgi:cytochrome c oxidase subunit IV
MTDPHHDRSHRRPHRYRELWLGPVLIWLLLLAILAASAWSAFLPLGPLNPTLNLLLAALMLFILAAYLMNLRSAGPVLRMVAASGLFWVIFLFALTFADYLSRRPTAGAAPSIHTSAMRAEVGEV